MSFCVCVLIVLMFWGWGFFVYVLLQDIDVKIQTLQWQKYKQLCCKSIPAMAEKNFLI